MFPCFSLKHAVLYGGREFTNTVWVSPSFWMAKGWWANQTTGCLLLRKVGRRKDCLPADLPQSGERKRTRKTWIDEGRSLLTTQGFRQRTRKRECLCSHPEAGVALHSRFQKKNFVKEKQKTKQLITSHPSKGILWAEAPYQNQHFSLILTLARARSKKPFCLYRKILQGISQNFNTNRTGREMFS